MNERRRARRTLFVVAALLVLLLGGAATQWALRDGGSPADDETVDGGTPGGSADTDDAETDAPDSADGTRAPRSSGTSRAARPEPDEPATPKDRKGRTRPEPQPKKDDPERDAPAGPPDATGAAGAAKPPVELSPPEKQATSAYGMSVAIDGDLAVVGDPDSLVGTAAAGAVFVFERRSAAWAYDARIAAPSGAQGGRFGRWVAVSGGRVFASSGGAEARGGAVHVFERGPGGWDQSARIDAPANAKEPGFAGPLSADGVLLLSGNDGLATGAKPNASGAHLLGMTTGAGWAIQTPLAWKPPRVKETAGLRLGAGVACAPPFLAVSVVADNKASRRKGRNDAGRVVVWNIESMASEAQDEPVVLDLTADGIPVLMGPVAAATTGSRGSLRCSLAAPAISAGKDQNVALLATWRLEHGTWSGGSATPLPEWAAAEHDDLRDDWPWPVAMHGTTLVAAAPVGRDKEARATLPPVAARGASAIAVFRDDGTSWVPGAPIVDPAPPSKQPRTFAVAVALSRGALVAGSTSPNRNTPGTAWVIELSAK